MLEVKDRAVKLVGVIAAETAIAEEKLAAAKPALDAAEAALQVMIQDFIRYLLCQRLYVTYLSETIHYVTTCYVTVMLCMSSTSVECTAS